MGLTGWWLRGELSPNVNGFFLGTFQTDRPLVKYEIAEMAQSPFVGGIFTISKELGDYEEYTSYLFSYEFYPNFDTDQPKITTGQINIPKYGTLELDDEKTEVIGTKGYPIVLMLRGFVSQEIYETGIGSRNAATYFASRGYVTIAPDFLGYAGSDENAADIFESRFQTYTTAISLLRSIESFSDASIFISQPLDQSIKSFLTNRSTIQIWAHSNGGQIALTLLEVTKASYPTTLWAPVTKGFPYSILYYTDESADGGKFIRKELAKFEQLYDADKFSIDRYLENIQAPIQLHQGTADDAVPLSWSNQFVSKLRNEGNDISYFTYDGADHNLRPSWNEVVARDVEFFDSYLETDRTP